MRALKTFIPLFVLLFAFAPAQAKEDSPMAVEGTATISVDEAKALFDNGVVFVDVRGDSDFEAGRIPGALHLNSKTALNEASLIEVAKKDQVHAFFDRQREGSRLGLHERQILP